MKKYKITKGLEGFYVLDNCSDKAMKALLDMLNDTLNRAVILKTRKDWRRFTLQFWTKRVSKDDIRLAEIVIWSHDKKTADEIKLIDTAKRRRKCNKRLT